MYLRMILINSLEMDLIWWPDRSCSMSETSVLSHFQRIPYITKWYCSPAHINGVESLSRSESSNLDLCDIFDRVGREQYPSIGYTSHRHGDRPSNYQGCHTYGYHPAGNSIPATARDAAPATAEMVTVVVTITASAMEVASAATTSATISRIGVSGGTLSKCRRNSQLLCPATNRSLMIRSRAVWLMSPNGLIANVSNSVAKMDWSSPDVRVVRSNWRR